MELKPCPRRSCRGKAELTRQLIEDERGKEHLRARVVCLRCATAGPWGAAPGVDGDLIATNAWNEEWGR